MEISIADIRLTSQQLSGTDFKTPADIVSWMGAMQAQDYNMAKWAIGIRSGCTNKLVEAAFNNGEILRTHVLRPTWHFVAPKDIRWMLELTGPRIRSSTKARDRNLEITEDDYIQSNRIIQKTLEDNNHLTREELATALEKSNIAVNPSRIIHFMMRAELDGVTCSGAMHGKKHTYALLDEWVPKTKPLNKDEALAKLAQIYFTSHCPATLQDFVWWSGLSTTEARHALEMVKPNFVSETIHSQVYWMTNSSRNLSAHDGLIHLLPAFDEYIISYKDRKAILATENHSRAISSNGIFRPTITRNGLVIGIWKKSTKKNRLVEMDYFEQQDKQTEAQIEQAAIQFGLFLK